MKYLKSVLTFATFAQVNADLAESKLRVVAVPWLGAEILESIKYHEVVQDNVNIIAANVSQYKTTENQLQKAIEKVASDVKLQKAANESLADLKDLLVRRANLVDYDAPFVDLELEGEVAKKAGYTLFQAAQEVSQFSFPVVPPKIENLRQSLLNLKTILASLPKGWNEAEGGKVNEVHVAALKPPMQKVKTALDSIVRASAISWVGAEILDIIEAEFYRANVTLTAVSPNTSVNVPSKWVSIESSKLWGWQHPAMRVAQKVATRISTESSINDSLAEIREHLRDYKKLLFTPQCRSSNCQDSKELLHVIAHLMELRELLKWRATLYAETREVVTRIIERSEMLSKSNWGGCLLVKKWAAFHAEVIDRFSTVTRLNYRLPVPQPKNLLTKSMNDWAALARDSAVPETVDACLAMPREKIDIVRDAVSFKLQAVTKAVQGFLLPDNLPL